MSKRVVFLRHHRIGFPTTNTDELNEHAENRNSKNKTTKIQMLLVCHPNEHSTRSKLIVIVVILS